MRCGLWLGAIPGEKLIPRSKGSKKVAVLLSGKSVVRIRVPSHSWKFLKNRTHDGWQAMIGRTCIRNPNEAELGCMLQRIFLAPPERGWTGRPCTHLSIWKSSWQVSHNIFGIFHAASSYSDTLIANSSDDEHGAEDDAMMKRGSNKRCKRQML